ncbi:MAG: hypothetical protein EOO61_12645 [Hymenobacter sp.]|nr:MAG: hypothetical protein EOO61_12645 [Hymenobacter sp.]
MKLLLPLAFLFFITACDTGPGFSDSPLTMAYVPIYADTSNPGTISIESSRPTSSAGKIYVYGRYIFQNEQNEGIHIIDNSDPQHPVKKAFLSIPFNTEMAIRSHHIYANSINDIVVIDLADPLQPSVVNRIKNAFPMINQNFPPDAGLFVCPDARKGIVVGWKLDNVEAFCRR